MNILLEKCECGDTCEMKDGRGGLCDMMGRCHPASKPPSCDEWDECECGKRCKMDEGGIGICQNDGTCALNTIRPNCTDWPGNIRAMICELIFKKHTIFINNLFYMT